MGDAGAPTSNRFLNYGGQQFNAAGGTQNFGLQKEELSELFSELGRSLNASSHADRGDVMNRTLHTAHHFSESGRHSEANEEIKRAIHLWERAPGQDKELGLKILNTAAQIGILDKDAPSVARAMVMRFELLHDDTSELGPALAKEAEKWYQWREQEFERSVLHELVSTGARKLPSSFDRAFMHYIAGEALCRSYLFDRESYLTAAGFFRDALNNASGVSASFKGYVGLRLGDALHSACTFSGSDHDQVDPEALRDNLKEAEQALRQAIELLGNEDEDREDCAEAFLQLAHVISDRTGLDLDRGKKKSYCIARFEEACRLLGAARKKVPDAEKQHWRVRYNLVEATVEGNLKRLRDAEA